MVYKHRTDRLSLFSFSGSVKLSLLHYGLTSTDYYNGGEGSAITGGGSQEPWAELVKTWNSHCMGNFERLTFDFEPI